MKAQSKTDFARVKREAAADALVAFDPAEDLYNPNDAVAVEAFWDGAVVKRGGVEIGRVTRGKNKKPTKEQVAIRYDADVLAAFKSSGKGWQTRMNEALRDWLKTHSPA